MKEVLKLLEIILLLIFSFEIVLAETVWDVNLNETHHVFKGVGWNVQFDTSYLEQLYPLLDDTTPQFIRVWPFIESYQPGANTTTYESQSSQKLYSFLQYAKDNNISIMLSNMDDGGKWDNYYACSSFGGWDSLECPNGWPDHPFWLSDIYHSDSNNSQNRFCHRNYIGDPGICTNEEKKGRIDITGVESDHPYSEAVFAKTLVDYLDYIINNKGYKIDFFSLWNEPNGDWSYHPRNDSKKYPASFTGLYQNVYQELNNRNLLNKVKLAAMDEVIDNNTKYNINAYATGTWNSYVQAYSMHNYNGEIGDNGAVKYLFDKAEGKPIIVPETGHTGPGGCEGGGFDRWGNSIESTRMMISDIRHGVYADARWWFNGGFPDTDCWVALNMTETSPGVYDVSQPIPETYNSLKILANTLPQTQGDLSVVKTNFGDFGEDFEAVVINADSTGLTPRLVVWAVNKGQEDYHLNLNISGLPYGTINISTKILRGIEPFKIENGLNYTISSPENEINFVVPFNSIFIAEADIFSLQEAGSSCGFADTNKNHIVEIREIINYISSWKQGNVAIGDLINAIEKWKNGC